MKICVYGTLRAGHGNHRCLETSPLLGAFRLKGFSMVSLGGFPAIDYDEGGEVFVEVYEAGPEAEARCNRLEGYDPDRTEQSFYDRVEIDTPYGEAVVYIIRGVLGEGYDRIEDGDWGNYMGQASPRYANGW